MFPVSLLFTADAHQETVEIFWLYGWEAFILAVFIYSLRGKDTHKKASSLWALLENVTHQTPDTFSEPWCIFSQACDVRIRDLLDLFLNAVAETHMPFITLLLH